MMATQQTLSLSTARERFTTHLKAEGRSDYTILAYANDVAQLIQFLAGQNVTEVSAVGSEHIETFKEQLTKEKYQAKSVSRKLNGIKTFFRFLKEEEIIKDDPAEEVAHPKYETKPPRILSKLEYRALRDACRADPRIAAIVELMLQTGIRIGEVAGLQLEDVKGSKLMINAYHSQPERTVPLNKAARQAIERYLKQRAEVKSNNIFVTKTGRPLLVRNIRSAVNRFFRIAGIKNATVNDLRNTWIAYQLASGTNIHFVSKMAGHKRISSTQKYLEALEEKEGTSKEKEELQEL